MRILEYKDIDRAEWSGLVASSTTGTWFQSPEAFEFFAGMPELFKPFVIGIENLQYPISNLQSRLRAVCVGYVTVERNPIKQFFTRRAIILGGPALAEDATDEEVVALMNGVKELMSERVNGAPIYVETRNFNSYAKWRNAFETTGFSYQPHLNFHVDCTDKEAMWERLSDNRKRQVRHANGDLKFKIADCRLDPDDVTEQDVREWYKVLEHLYRTKVKTPLWPVEFFIEAYRQGVGRFMLVRHEGKIIGGSMVVADEKAVYEWFECGLNAEYKEQYPSVMATYAGMLYAAEEGIARYDMMGAGVPDVPYGVRDFKAEFGGMMVEHGRFLHVAKPCLYAIGNAVVKAMKG